MSGPPAVPQVDEYECAFRISLPDVHSTRLVLSVIKEEPEIQGTTKFVQLWPEDLTRCTVMITVRAKAMRPLRSAVNSFLEQSKLVIRTIRAFPPTSTTT